MKCIYAIPFESSVSVRKLCREYEEALQFLSDSVILKSDDLHDVVEGGGWPMLKIEDEDWSCVKTAIVSDGSDKRGCWKKFFIHYKEAKAPGGSDELVALVGELFWSANEAMSVAIALKTNPGPVYQSVALWLLSHAERGRSFVILAA